MTNKNNGITKIDLIRIEIANLNKIFQEHREEDKAFKDETIKFFHMTTELRVNGKNIEEKIDKIAETYETHLEKCHSQVKDFEKKLSLMEISINKNSSFRRIIRNTVIGSVLAMISAFFTAIFTKDYWIKLFGKIF